MKKFVFGFLVFLISVIFVACNNGSENNADTKVVNVQDKESQNNANNNSEEKNIEENSDENNEKEKLEIAWFENPPYIFIDPSTGKLKGALYELIEEHLKPDDVEFVWDKESTTIPRHLAELEAGKKVYAAALLTKTPDREKFASFTPPYFYSQSIIALKIDSKLNEVNSIEDILDLTIGYAEKAHVTPFMTDKRLKMDLISTSNYHETNLNKIISNRIDAAYAPDKAAFLALVKKMNLENKIKLLNLPENKTPFSVTFSKPASKISEKVNNICKNIDIEKIFLEHLSNYIDTSKL